MIKINFINCLFFAAALCLFACEDFFELKKENLLGFDIFQNISDTSATIQSELIYLNGNEAIIQHGHCWALDDQPTIADEKTALGQINSVGVFESELKNLKMETIYFVRAYLQTENKTIYGEVLNFQTLRDVNLPSITTTAINNISNTKAQAEGNLLQKGNYNIIAYGHCWATASNPTIQNAKSDLGSNPNIGNFLSELDMLTPNTSYFIRTYIQFENTTTNQTEVIYGNELNFKSANN